MKSFFEIDGHEFQNGIILGIKSEIEGRSKEYILGVDEFEFKKYLIDKYSLEPLKIHFDKEFTGQPISGKEWAEDQFYGKRYQRDIYTFTCTYPFSGTSSLFKVRPTQSFNMISYEIKVEDWNNTVSFSFKIANLDQNEYNRLKNSAFSGSFANVDNINSFVVSCNQQIQFQIDQLFAKQKEKYLKENDFFAAINIPLDKNTQSIFTPPLLKKKDIPQPAVNKNQEFSSEPTMATTMYEDVLKIIYDAGKSMERKPSLYLNKDEEGLRDQFLFFLETRYDSVTATGETFNRDGKTDILLKYSKDGTNLFVAECKFWRGFQGFLDTISQLFDRYLSWRDSKVAIMIFVKNKDFTSVLKNIAAEIRNHQYYLKNNGQRGESSFSYIFRLPQDQEKQVLLEVMAFHYDKEQ
ncbi:MAG TPA: hypothetical protein VHE59_19090 [Mucilaginibacter sp.]|nr:hypothetical protein [Mucilaginibacter sp.]